MLLLLDQNLYSCALTEFYVHAVACTYMMQCINK